MNPPAIPSRWLGTQVAYNDALRLQNELVAARQAGQGGDTLLLLEHAPVYTIGRTRDQSSLRDPDHLPYPVVVINRGGQATYHGPGQLVCYPILDLRPLGKDLHAYLRTLEEAILRTLLHFGVAASRRDGLTGVWVGPRKIASIGVGIRKWIAMHGFALNVTSESLPPFLAITPCGIDGVTMTTLHAESTQRPSTQEVGAIVHHHLSTLLPDLAARDTP